MIRTFVKGAAVAMMAMLLSATISWGWERKSALFDDGSTSTASTATVENTSLHKVDAKPGETQAHTDDHHGEKDSHGGGHGHGNLGKELPLISIVPFVSLLLMIAVFPLTFHHWWESNTNKGIVAGLLALPIIGYFGVVHGAEGQTQLWHVFQEYLGFIALLAALYIISGGIYVQGSLSGTPLANTGMMALGAGIASIIGTTGASVLLIRPLLRANASRKNKIHIVIFFIFIVSNCGGLLTPLGDPPLFMGFQKGVPFEWTAIHLWKHWLVVNGALLVIFHIWDQVVLNREEKTEKGSQLEQALEHEPIRIQGLLNFLFLGGVVVIVILSGITTGPENKPLLPMFSKEILMGGLAAVAYYTTNPANRERNRFSFGPIVEVAVLFIGIFITMAPALLILNAWGSGDRKIFEVAYGVTEPWQYFWASGMLSSFLDNAPTYMTFTATASGQYGMGTDGMFLGEFVRQSESKAIMHEILVAVSCGAVFMGANSYIGNGPNFMVKAIAEENGVQMPSFFGYMLYSFGILLPLFAVLTWLMF